MNREDIQLLRQAAFELQEDSTDIVRVAGVVQRIKNWWKAKFNPNFAERQDHVEEAYDEMKGPLTELIGQLQQLDKAFQSQDPDTVAKLVGQVPAVISRVTKDMGNLKKEMEAADALVPVEYRDSKGNLLTNESLTRVMKGYKQHGPLRQKLIEFLPPEFVKEIPLGKRIDKKITDFSWFKRYAPEQIVFTGNARNTTKTKLQTFFGFLSPTTVETLMGGYEEFEDNLKEAILQNSIVQMVDFANISKKITQRTVGEMHVRLMVGPVNLPFNDMQIPINVGSVLLNDMGPTGRNELSVVVVTNFSISPQAREQLKQLDKSLQAEILSSVSSDGPITKIVKRAILQERLPLTRAVVKIGGQTFHHKARFAKLLSSALRQEIDAESSVMQDGDDIEVQVAVYGSESASLPAISGISTYLADEFVQATKMGIAADVVPGISSFALMESEVLDQSLRSVLFDSWRTK